MVSYFSIVLAIFGFCIRGYFSQVAVAGGPLCPCIIPVVASPSGYAYSADGAQALHADWYGLSAAQAARRQNMNAQSGISQRRQNLNAQSGISQRRQNLNAQTDISQGYLAEPEVAALPETVVLAEPAVAVAEPAGAYATFDGGFGQALTSNILSGLNAVQGRRQNMNAQSNVSQRRQNLNAQAGVNQAGK